MQSSSLSLIARLKAVADPYRLRLLALCARGECSVSELTEVLSLSQPRVSQHLKSLCDAGLLRRFRDGQFVYYRVPVHGDEAAERRQIMGLLPYDEPAFEQDYERLRLLRGELIEAAAEGDVRDDRALHRALVELTVTSPLGDLLDIGSGQGRLLKLLASRAKRAVGVDIDATARRFARAGLLLAELPNCTLRQGDMYALPFDDQSFDTVILDDVLQAAAKPAAAIGEAARVLRRDGRLLFLLRADRDSATDVTAALATWSKSASLRVSAPRLIPSRAPEWLLAVATPGARNVEAA